MESQAAVEALSALASPSRLAAFRLLVKAGPAGLAAGDLARGVGVPPSTLSGHLTLLAHASLVTSRREGRSILYAADYGRHERAPGVPDRGLLRRRAGNLRPAGRHHGPRRLLPAGRRPDPGPRMEETA